MDILLREYGAKTPTLTSVAIAVEDNLQPSCWDCRGTMEKTQALVDNAARALAQLIDLLADKGILLEVDLNDFVSGTIVSTEKDEEEVEDEE